MTNRVATRIAVLTIIVVVTIPSRVAARGPASLAWASGVPRYRITDLGTLGGAFSRANAINSHGQIVGGSYNRTPDPTITGSNEVRAVLRERGRMIDLGTAGGPDANQINGNVTGATGIPRVTATPSRRGRPAITPFCVPEAR